MLWFINKYSKIQNIIVDLFLGSGSTLIAAEKINRICYGMEIDPHYCDVIVKRFSNYTEEKKCIKLIRDNKEKIIEGKHFA